MPDTGIPETADTGFVVDKKFAEYMYYVATASLDNIKNCMKRNLGNIRSYNIGSYEKILQCYNTFNYWGKIDPEKNIYELMENRSEALKAHHNDFTWLYGRLCDYRSKKTLFGIVENWLTFSMVSLDRIIEKTFHHYFDLDIMKCDANEVFVDLGAYTGDTVQNYLGSYNGYKKIYCYEIAPQIYKKLRQNLEQYPNIEFREKGAEIKKASCTSRTKNPRIRCTSLQMLGRTKYRSSRSTRISRSP